MPYYPLDLMAEKGGVEVRQWLIEERKKQGFTQLEIAEMAGISRSYYTQIESQYINKGISVKTAKKLAKAMDLDWTIFFENHE